MGKKTKFLIISLLGIDFMVVGSPASVASCGSLDILLQQGLTAKERGNTAQAARLYQKACDGKCMRGCLLLGFIEGQRGAMAAKQGLLDQYKRSKLKTERLIQRACDGGEMIGCSSLCHDGYVYNMRPLKNKVVRLCQRACDGGEMKGCFYLGLVEEEKGNTTKAASSYQKACDGGFALACKKLQ